MTALDNLLGEVITASGRSQTAHRTGIKWLAHTGAVAATALAAVTELFRDWAPPLAVSAQGGH
jgi:hypothetical protein